MYSQDVGMSRQVSPACRQNKQFLFSSVKQLFIGNLLSVFSFCYLSKPVLVLDKLNFEQYN